MLFRKEASVKERANAALASLQRNAYALSTLRSRLESRINFVIGNGGANSSESSRELTKVLQLVKASEIILNEMSEKIESARFLEEFILIIDSAAASVRDIKSDVEGLVPMAEAALSEMHDAIARISMGATQQPEKCDPAILAQISATLAAGEREQSETEIRGAPAERKEIEDKPEKEEKHEIDAEGVPA